MIICITTALKSEALPIIEAFNLKPIQGYPLFPIWQNEKIKLTVSGIGKVKAAAACGYLAGIYQDEDIYGWLNVGIAGHKSLPVGTPLFAHLNSTSKQYSTFNASQPLALLQSKKTLHL